MKNRKTKIAVIGLKGLPAFGGAATVGENIIEQLKNEYDFTVYSISSHTELKTGYYNGYRQIVFRKIPFKRLNSLYYYIVSALHAIFLGKYDLVHLHHRDAAFIIFLLRLRYKVILTTHGIFQLTEKWKRFLYYFKVQEYYFMKFANILTCVSLNEKRRIKNKLGLNAYYIPNGIVIKKNNKEIQYKNYIFFAAGRIIHSKGLDILLKALHKLHYKDKLLVAGDLDQTLDYKKEILYLSRGLNIKFLGLIKNKDELMSFCKNAKLFIFPSSIEAMSIMLLEAASQKVPIIASDIAENKDIFSSEEVLFFETDNYDDLAFKIEWALNHIHIMKTKAENAYNKLESYYSWNIIADKYSNIYKTLLN